MPSELKIYPYKMSSKSAKSLAEALDIKRVRADGNYYHHPNHIVINWGNSKKPNWYNNALTMLNSPIAVQKSCNKLTTFKILQEQEVQIPEYTTDRNLAKQWLHDEKIVVARATLTGHSGQGITIYDSFGGDDIDSLEGAPLYTKHLRHKREFRIHVVNGIIIDAIEKKKSREENVNLLVRSHDNGWIFCRNDVVIPTDVYSQALRAIEALSLDFGAVDIAYREQEDKAYVLEVNTAPGIQGTTLKKYIGAFNEMVS